ncbi:MAG: transporter [Polyangiaceae bacterium]|nr:transporter [Polyangiaceae bacterium]
MKRNAAAAGAAVVSALSHQAAIAGEDGIVTDRPDVGESSETVGALRLQIETSGLVETERESKGRVTAVRTPTKIRLGLIDALEVHLETDGLAHERVRASSEESADASGVTDVGTGGKVHLIDQQHVLPSSAILVSLTIPAGSHAFSDGNASLSPTLATSWDLDGDWSVGTNLGATAALTERDSHPDTLRFAVALWRSWAPLSERLSSFIEPSGEIPLDATVSAIQVQGGFAYLVRPLAQLDLAVVRGLSSAAADYGATVGCSVKI